MFCNGLRCDNPVCAYSQGRDYNTVDSRRFQNTSAAWTGPSKQQAYLKSKFVSNDYTNPNTNPKTLTTLTWTLTDRHDVYKDILYAIRSFNTTDNALSGETCV